MCKMLQAYMLPALKGLITSFDRRGIQFTEETHSAHPSSAKTVRHIAFKKKGLHRKRFFRERGYPLFLLV